MIINSQDPHYAGKDDIKQLIQNKQQMEGYKAMCCGWRTIRDIFHEKDYYRICLPQRPSVYFIVSFKQTIFK